MELRQAQRLLRAAKAVEESPIPKAFTMACFFRGDGINELPQELKQENWCGTPACVLGHYASRPDLQRFMRIESEEVQSWSVKDSEIVTYDSPQIMYTNRYVDQSEMLDGSIQYGDDIFLNHFGVTRREAEWLFGEQGCGRAKTPKQAAAYIRRFVKKKFGSLPAI